MLGAGKYRSWKIGRKSMKADEPAASVRVYADQGFTFEARTDPNAAPAEILNAPYAKGWTIIDWMNSATKKSKSGRCFVRLEIKGTDKQKSEEKPAAVWFAIKPVESREQK